VENTGNTILYVTTADFKIKDKVADKYLTEKEIRTIFPPDSDTGDYIEFLVLYPKLSDEIPGEKIHLIADFSKEFVYKNGSYTTVNLAVYNNTKDTTKIEEALAKNLHKWKEEGYNKDEIDLKAKNFELLDALRITIPDDFEFRLQTIGVYENTELMIMSCLVMMQKLKTLDGLIETGELPVEKSQTTLANSWDIRLDGEDYTVGRVLEGFLHKKYITESNVLDFCGFDKKHPHDTYSIIRVAFKEPQEKAVVYQILREIIAQIIDIYEKIQEPFVDKFLKSKSIK
jgi:DNA-directed RNA polymerase subunit L